MNDTVCHPKWVEGFVEECRNQGFTEKQASVFLEAALQQQMSEPMEKNAFRMLGKLGVGLAGLGLAGYGAHALSRDAGDVRTGFGQYVQSAYQDLQNAKRNIANGITQAVGNATGADIADQGRIGEPRSRGQLNNSAFNRAPAGGYYNNSYYNGPQFNQRNIDAFTQAAGGNMNNLTPAQRADARVYKQWADAAREALARGDRAEAEQYIARMNQIGGAGYAGSEYARQQIQLGKDRYFNSVGVNGQAFDEKTYHNMQTMPNVF